MNRSSHSHRYQNAESTSKEDFANYCNEAYNTLIYFKGKKTKIRLNEIKDSNLAIRRMLGLFIDREEFEKCTELKELLDLNFEGNNEPIFDYREL